MATNTNTLTVSNEELKVLNLAMLRHITETVTITNFLAATGVIRVESAPAVDTHIDIVNVLSQKLQRAVKAIEEEEEEAKAKTATP